jgi:hypothetical protein
MAGTDLPGALKGVAVTYALWPVVMTMWVAAFYVARYLEFFSAAALLAAINFELLRWRHGEGGFLEYFNSALFCALVMLGPYFTLPTLLRIPFTSDMSLAFTALVAWGINRRYRLPSLTALMHMLLIAAMVGSVLDLWQHFYVPRQSVRSYSLALDLYYNWSKPAEMALIAGPFLVHAIWQDIRAISRHAMTSPTLDSYYSYSLPFLAFGFFPGVGRGLIANCERPGTFVAIAGIVAHIAFGLVLSLVFNRRSILMGAAASSLLLIINRCIELPVEYIAAAVTAAMLIAWRWLPKGRIWSGESVSA